MGFNFIDDGVGQAYLMPPDPRDWLPAGHLAWRVREVVAGMDLSGFLRAYRADGQGAAAFRPAAMAAALLYCYCKGIRSSRAIESASYDDVGVRVLLGNNHPDHATVARFIDRHREQVQSLFVQVLAYCARQGLVTVDVVAADGTKVKANASMDATVSAEQLDLQIANLERVLAGEIERWLDEASRVDTPVDSNDEHSPGPADEHGPGPGGSAAPQRAAARTAGKLLRRQAARAQLEAERQARLAQAEAAKQHAIRARAGQLARARRCHEQEIAKQQARVDTYHRRLAEHATGQGCAPGGPIPVPAAQAKHVRNSAERVQRAQQRLAEANAAPLKMAGRAVLRVNTTDPTSRIMHGKNKAYLQGHNVQVLANKNQIILGIATHASPTDVAALHPLLRQARSNLDAAGLGTPLGTVLADAGYASTDNFTTPCEADLLIAVTNDARQTGRRTDATPKQLKAWTDMAQRLATETGKALYKRRSPTIEPIFAQLFQRLGRALNYRNHHTITELILWATTHNLLKAIRHRPTPRTA